MLRSATRPRPTPRASVPALLLLAVVACTPRTRPAEESKSTPTPTPTPEEEAPTKAAEPAPEPTPSITRHEPRPRTIAVGGGHVCALTGAGEVACWGGGADGQLGPGVSEHRATPTTIAGIGDAVALLANQRVTCALRADRSVTCWGKLRADQASIQTTRALGEVVEVAMTESYGDRLCARRSDGTVACVALASLATDVPMVVPDVTDAVGIDVTYRDLYVLRANGDAAEYSFSSRGDLEAPKPIEGGPVVDLGRIDGRICMLHQSGELRCRLYPEWRAEVPTAGPLWKAKITGELWATAVDYDARAGVHCARNGEGAVLCWGDNTLGQLGYGTPAYLTRPRRILEGAATAVYAGADATCGVFEGGALRCFEHTYGDEHPEVEGVRSLAISVGHNCAIVGGGEARCWGFTETGALGVPGSPDGVVRVPGLSNLAFIGVGSDHSCAVRRDHRVHCWGSGAVGQLADRFFLDRTFEAGDEPEDENTLTFADGPVQIKGVAGDVTGLAVAADYTCVASTSGLYCWGTIPEPGDRDDALILSPEQFLAGPVRLLDAEDGSLCLIDGDDALRCWGAVAERYRDGAFVVLTPVEEPEEVTDDGVDPFAAGGPLWKLEGISVGATGIAVGAEHACLLTATGEIHCWGDNNQGQLGDGTTRDRPDLAKVQGLPGPATQIAAGEEHTCARLEGGAVYCWGAKTSTPEHGRRTAPAPVVGLAPYTRGLAPPTPTTPAGSP